MGSKSDVQLTELYERSRSQFPVFDSSLKNMAFMENAGGSQASTQFQHISGSSEHMKFHVSHSISGPSLCGRCYQRSFTFQQRSIGAGHELSNRSTAVVEKAHNVIKARTSHPSAWPQAFICCAVYIFDHSPSNTGIQRWWFIIHMCRLYHLMSWCHHPSSV